MRYTDHTHHPPLTLPPSGLTDRTRSAVRSGQATVRLALMLSCWLLLTSVSLLTVIAQVPGGRFCLSPGIAPERSAATIPDQGGYYNIEVVVQCQEYGANLGVFNSAPDWINVIDVRRTEFSINAERWKIQYRVSRNDATTERSGFIKYSMGLYFGILDIKQKAKVIQPPPDKGKVDCFLEINLSRQLVNFDSKGGSGAFQVTIYSNCQIKPVTATSSDPWITNVTVKAPGLSSELPYVRTISYEVVENTGTAKRSGWIQLTFGNEMAKHEIRQEGAVIRPTPTPPPTPTPAPPPNPPVDRPLPPYELSINTFSGSGEDQKPQLKIASDWKIRTDVPWLKISPDSGRDTTTLTLSADLNPDPGQRAAIITLETPQDTYKFSVHQLSNPNPVPRASLLCPEVFDAEFYLHINPDVRNAIGAGNYAGAKSHWLTNGIYEGRMASPGFHSDYYLAVNPDLRNALGDKKYAAATVHWLRFGLKEGRKSSPLLHSRYYLGLYPDLQKVFGPENYAAAALHFAVNGLNEARSGSPWFDPGWYLRNNPGVAEVHGATNYKAAAGHWIYSGRNEGRAGSLFGEMIPFGPIQDKWEALGASLSSIGNPITPTTPLQYGEGKFNHFERGSIYWSPRTGAFMIWGGIREKWASMGWEWSFLGYPTTDELPTPDGIGRFNHFEHGSIYWTHQTGAHEVHGGIRAKWASLGWERSFLGYPVTDEQPTPDGIGRFNHFQNGSIYWTDKTGAHEVHGGIRALWASLGWERSPLGYPVTDEMPTPDGRGRMSRFQGGAIIWYPETGARVVR